jgi:hypothetical protein
MLRPYKPIVDDPIFELHAFAEHLVCDIWCNADGNDCIAKIKEKFNDITSYDWLKEEVVKIDKLCQNLNSFGRARIKFAFLRNNDIEALCNGESPVSLNQLPKVVEKEMKPLFIKFYEYLLGRDKVKGDKLQYYIELYKANRFKFCACCGYMAFDTGQLDRREAYDHYLPKSDYPFASVNFKNLVPLCYKCNSDRKKDKDPVKNGRKAFYPYRNHPIDIDINTSLGAGFIPSLYECFVNDVDENDLDVPKVQDVNIELLSNEQEQIETWEDLFQIRGRFSERTSQFSFGHLNKMKRRFNDKKSENSKWEFVQTLDYYIRDYEKDKYTDEKFLKIPFMHAIKKCDSLMKVYA